MTEVDSEGDKGKTVLATFLLAVRSCLSGATQGREDRFGFLG